MAGQEDCWYISGSFWQNKFLVMLTTEKIMCITQRVTFNTVNLKQTYSYNKCSQQYLASGVTKYR